MMLWWENQFILFYVIFIKIWFGSNVLKFIKKLTVYTHCSAINFGQFELFMILYILFAVITKSIFNLVIGKNEQV